MSNPLTQVVILERVEYHGWHEVGDIATVPEKQARSWCDLGYAMPLERGPSELTGTANGSDMPGLEDER